MESTEHPLGEAHLAGCLALSPSARWNQNEADWRLMLRTGHGWGISLADGTLVASTLVLPYGADFAWISMVLVHPAHRRKGHASRLLRTAIADLANRGLTPILDATPAGRAVYRREGFEDRWGFSRLFLQDAFRQKEPAIAARRLEESDWRWVMPLDEKAFGAGREPLLRSLAARLPEAAWVCEGRGFVLGREGREARQVGPVVALDREAADALLLHALQAVRAPLFVDVSDHASGLRVFLQAGGFRFQRPFTRMVRGARRAPGDEQRVFLVAGPELG
jgi:hypothetical protein